MEDKYIRGDLFRLGVLLIIIVGIMASLKVYDHKTNAIGDFGAKIFNGIIAK